MIGARFDAGAFGPFESHGGAGRRGPVGEWMPCVRSVTPAAGYLRM